MSAWVTGRRKRKGPNPYGYGHQLERKRLASAPKVCGICGQPIAKGEPWHLDHVLPISLGGLGGPTQPAHRRCNILKGGRNRVRSASA